MIGRLVTNTKLWLKAAMKKGAVKDNHAVKMF